MSSCLATQLLLSQLASAFSSTLHGLLARRPSLTLLGISALLFLLASLLDRLHTHRSRPVAPAAHPAAHTAASPALAPSREPQR